MLRGSRAFSGKIHRPFLAHVVPSLAARISWRRLVAKVGTFENKKVHNHLHLWPLGPHRRRLAVRAGTSKSSTISRYGCSTFGALATEGPVERRRRRKEEEELFNVDKNKSVCSSTVHTIMKRCKFVRNNQVYEISSTYFISGSDVVSETE